MRKSRVLTGALAVAAFTGASMFAAAPANAAELPQGQQITVIDYFEDFSQFYEASPADATLTTVGSGQGLDATQITAVDVGDDGLGYALAQFSGDPGVSSLYEADANTGELSSPLLMMLNFGDVQVEAEYCSALDYSNGILMAICYDSVEGVDVAYWGIVDPAAATGEAWLSPLYQFDGQEFLYFDSMAVDPISGLVYAVAYPDGASLFTLSQDAGATFVTTLDNNAYGFDFDRDGQAWVTSTVQTSGGEFPTYASALATLDLTDGSNPFEEVMTFSGEEFSQPYIQPVTVWGPPAAVDPVPALAATGLESSALVIGAGGLLFVGVILAASTTVRRRQTEV